MNPKPRSPTSFLIVPVATVSSYVSLTVVSLTVIRDSGVLRFAARDVWRSAAWLLGRSRMAVVVRRELVCRARRARGEQGFHGARVGYAELLRATAHATREPTGSHSTPSDRGEAI